MVKIAAKDAESFAKTPPGPELRAVLVYGPDAGLVAERAKALAAGAAGDLDDPFRLIQLGAEQLAGDPARLADEAAALSFSGGRRVVWVRGAGDGLAGACKDFVAERPGEALVVLEAGDLPARSALRKLFESAGPGVAALPCYRDEARDLSGLAREVLGSAGLTISRDALQALTEALGGDRQLTRRELEKLVLYMADQGGEVGLEDVRAVVGDVSAYAQEDIALAVGSGDLATLDRLLARAFAEGLQPVSLLRRTAGHFERLMQAAALLAAGANEQAALAKLRPPVFWKLRGPFLAQARAWPLGALENGLARLIAAEIQCKTTGLPAETMAGRALLALAARSPLRRKGRAA